MKRRNFLATAGIGALTMFGLAPKMSTDYDHPEFGKYVNHETRVWLNNGGSTKNNFVELSIHFEHGTIIYSAFNIKPELKGELTSLTKEDLKRLLPLATLKKSIENGLSADDPILGPVFRMKETDFYLTEITEYPCSAEAKNV